MYTCILKIYIAPVIQTYKVLRGAAAEQLMTLELSCESLGGHSDAICSSTRRLCHVTGPNIAKMLAI